MLNKLKLEEFMEWAQEVAVELQELGYASIAKLIKAVNVRLPYARRQAREQGGWNGHVAVIKSMKEFIETHIEQVKENIPRLTLVAYCQLLEEKHYYIEQVAIGALPVVTQTD